MAKFTSTGHFAEEIAFVVSAAGITALVAGSASVQIVTGALTQTLRTPLATDLVLGSSLTIINRSTDVVTVELNSGAAGTTVPADSSVTCRVSDVTIADGIWDFDAGGGSSLVAGGLETTELLTVSPHTVPVGTVHFHPFLTVPGGDDLIIDGKLLTTDDTIIGTVTVNVGGIWKVL